MYRCVLYERGGAVSGIRLERQGRWSPLRLDKPRGNAIDEPFAQELIQAGAPARG